MRRTTHCVRRSGGVCASSPCGRLVAARSPKTQMEYDSVCARARAMRRATPGPHDARTSFLWHTEYFISKLGTGAPHTAHSSAKPLARCAHNTSHIYISVFTHRVITGACPCMHAMHACLCDAHICTQLMRTRARLLVVWLAAALADLVFIVSSI